MNLFENQSDLTQALDHLYEFINHNTPVDHHSIAKTLRENGYVEPMWGKRFFRAIAHAIQAGDARTIEDVYLELKAHPAMRLGGAQSFTDNLEDALQFIGGTIHLAHYDGKKWLEHQPHQPVPISGVWVVYEVTANPDAILWSTAGLRIMARSQPEIADKIKDILEEYGYQQEIVLETSAVRITDVHLYDSEDDEEEYTR